MIYCENCCQLNNRRRTSTVLFAACHDCGDILPCYSDQPLQNAYDTSATQIPKPPDGFNEDLKDAVKDMSVEERQTLMDKYADNLGAALVNVFDITLGSLGGGFYIKWLNQPETGAKGIVIVALDESAAAIQQLIQKTFGKPDLADSADDVFDDDTIH